MSDQKEEKRTKDGSNTVLADVNESPNNVNDSSTISLESDDANPSIYTLEKEVSQYLDRRERESTSYQYYPGAERMEYDFTSERHDMFSTNLTESAAHIMKGALGAGILSIHEGFMYGGLWTSLVFTLVIGSVVAYSMYMLAKSAQRMYTKLRVSKLSYPDLAEVSIGAAPCRLVRKWKKCFRYIVDLCLLLEMCGTCCIYQIMIANTMKQVLEHIYPSMTEIIEDIRMYILIVSLPLIFMCLIRNLKFLAPFSMIADLFVAICVLTTLYYSFLVADSISERPAWKSIGGFLRFCGICLYSVDGVAVCLPIENNMRKPRYFSNVLQIAMSIVTILVALTGFFGYWGWGEDCRSPITVHMPSNTFTIILQCSLALMLCVTFAIQFWVPFRVVWYYIGRRYKRRRGIWERFFRVIHVLVITGAAVASPDIVKVMIFLGNFFLGFMAFIFPAIIETMVDWTDLNVRRPRWKFIKNITMVLVGILLTVSAIFVGIDG